MTASLGSRASTQHEFPSFDDGSGAADIAGRSHAPTVLLHGGGQTRHAWGGTARAMAQAGWRSVALDLPGHGETAWSVAGEYLESMSRGMARFCKALGSPLAVAGASLGGHDRNGDDCARRQRCIHGDPDRVLA